jgi:hypothetical protein
MVKNDLMNLKATWIWHSVMCGSYVFMALLLFQTSPLKLEFLLLALYWAVLAIVNSERERRWKPMNERRQMAAWGFAAHVPLAQPHPLPNVGALPVPFTITLKPAWPKFLLALGILCLADLFVLASLFPLLGRAEALFSHPVLGSFVLFFTLVFCVMIFLWLRPQKIIVTQEGLTVRHATGWLYKTNGIYWRDARLFAIRGNKPGTPATRYELSGPYSVVQWQRLRHPRWWSLHRPAIPFAEYDAQMEALIALISGVTGLPLYDVR